VGARDDVGVSRDVDVDSPVNEDGEAGIGSIAMNRVVGYDSI